MDIEVLQRDHAYPIAEDSRGRIGAYARWHEVRAIWTGEKRPPKAGEWFLSGSIIEAYHMPNDGSQPVPIARLVLGREVTVFEPFVGGNARGGTPMEDELARLREAWNSYVFARRGIAPGAGMAVMPESECWETLSAAFNAFTATWDLGPTAAEVIHMIRQARADADAMAEQLANDIDIARPYARRAIGIAMRELLEEIPGTPEADAVAAAELRHEQELDERERQLHAADERG
jgi:hypothetical protein